MTCDSGWYHAEAVAVSVCGCGTNRLKTMDRCVVLCIIIVVGLWLMCSSVSSSG